jgi:hypothetical protein
MTARHAFVIVASFAVLVPAGCQRAGSTMPTPSTSVPATTPAVTAPAAADAPERTDYRTLSRTELESLIRVKMGVEMDPLVPGGLNHYNGQVLSPDGTRLPLEVTVEANRIFCDTKTANGALRQTITSRGIDAGQPIIK